MEGGQVGEAGALVSGFFGALESFDFALFEAVRFERPVAADGRQLLDSAVAALDRCLPDGAIHVSDVRRSCITLSWTWLHCCACCQLWALPLRTRWKVAKFLRTSRRYSDREQKACSNT